MYIVIMRVDSIIFKIYLVVLNATNISLNVALGGNDHHTSTSFEPHNLSSTHAYQNDMPLSLGIFIIITLNHTQSLMQVEQ